EEPGRRAEVADRGGDVAEHLAHVVGIGPRRLGLRLGAPQLGGRHHLHGLGDLLRRLGGGDAHPHVFKRGHLSLLPIVRPYPSSCPASCRASTSFPLVPHAKTWMAGHRRVYARLRRAMPGHDGNYANVFAYSLTAALSFSEVASSRSRVLRMVSRMSACLP